MLVTDTHPPFRRNRRAETGSWSPGAVPPKGLGGRRREEALVGAPLPTVLPPGYPKAYVGELRLADGRRVQVRPILPTDAPELADAIRHADADTLRSRFLGAAPPMSDALLKGLTELDYVHRFALVALAGGRGVAVARYIAIASVDPPVDPP